MRLRHIHNARGFFSDYYLGSVFGRGGGRRRRGTLSTRDTHLAFGRLRRLHQRAEERTADVAACRERFIRPFLRDVLAFHLGAGSDRLHGLFASADDEATGGRPLALCYAGAWAQDLDAGRGQARPGAVVEAELAKGGVAYGLLVTGERIRLVRAPGDGARGAYLEADLTGLLEDDDAESFAALYRLMSASSFQPTADGAIPIVEVERESRRHAERVSTDLKGAVFCAAEAVVDGLLSDAVAHQDISDARALSERELRGFRDAALLALYRLLFILYAEARDPRLDEHHIYRDSYSAQGLLDEILRAPGRAFAANRAAIWLRLLALFDIYDRGLPPITPWRNIPPRGGDFFSPATPEGQLLARARLPDRTVAEVLLQLATTAPRRGIGRERISFRELDIENLGAVYEGLLEFEPRVASATMFEVRVQGRSYVLDADEAMRLCRLKRLGLRGDGETAEGTPIAALFRDATPEADVETDERNGFPPDPNNGPNGDGVRKGATARLVRRFEPGAFHFVPGPSRKGSGSFYTPRPLVQDLVHHALGPAIEDKPAAAIERLRVVDPACGSGHFLVEAMRFLGQALHRAWVEEHGGTPPTEFRDTIGQGWDADWQASDEEARAARSEARAWCKRRIAERCLFGVDLNPTAVQLARVALWIESAAGDRPLTYFQHHVRQGNALLGTWLGRLQMPPVPALSPLANEAQPGLFETLVRDAVVEAARLRRSIDETAPDDLRREGIEPDTVGEQAFKDRQRHQAEELLATATLLCDLRSAAAFVSEIWANWHTLCSLVGSPEELRSYVAERSWHAAFAVTRARERFFHWELEFPEIFVETDRPGFDAVLGNPPWDKVLPARKDFYARHDVLIRAFTGDDLDRRVQELHATLPGLADEFEAYRYRTKIVASLLRKSGDFAHSEAKSGAAHEDVSKYFLDRAARLIRSGGAVGMVAPSVVYNGDGCVGLRRHLLDETSVERFYGFENRRKIFPIDSRYKFVSLVFRKSPASRAFEAAFMRHDLEELKAHAALPASVPARPAEERAPWVVTMRRDEINRLSPETSAFLEYRGPRDQEMLRRMHDGRSTLGDSGTASWDARLISWRAHEVVYNCSEDKDLWTDPANRRLYSPNMVLGRASGDFDETLVRMRERGFWPVFEGKHVDQFVVGIKPVRWWLSVEQAERKYGGAPRAEPTLVFRETARNTDERTCIAAVLPPCSVAAHTLTGVVTESINAHAAASVLNSLTFDWCLRLRTAGTHVSFTYIQPIPVPAPPVLHRLPVIPTRLAWNSGIQHVTEDCDLWPRLWNTNRTVAEAYGLGPTDLDHVLSAFPGMARKRRDFAAYLRARLAAWADEAGESYPPHGASDVLRVAERPPSADA